MSKLQAAPATESHTDFMKLEDAAKDIGCGKRWLADGARHHGFPHHRFGQSLQFSAQDRDEIRRLCRVPAEPGKIAQLRRSRKRAPRSKSAA